MKKCNICASQIRGDARFCPNCGSNNLEEIAEVKRYGKLGSLIKAILCAVAFIAVQYAVTFAFAVIDSIRCSIGTELSPEELEALLIDHLNSSTIVIGIISNIAVIALFAVYFLIRRKNLFAEFGMRKIPPLIAPLCALFGYAMQYALGFITVLIPWPEEWLALHSESTSSVVSGSLILVIIGTSVVTGFAEETVFRVLSMERLGRAWGGGVCVIVSAVVFGIAHLSPVAVFYATILGVILGCLYRKFRSVWPCAIVHMAFNLASVIGLPDDSLLLYFSVTAVSIGISIISAYLIFSAIEAKEEQQT